MYVRPAEAGVPLSFGVSGKLWREALVMYDRQTRSLWSQRRHRAIAGPLTGRTLEVVPSRITTWGDWKARHPRTTVLVKPAEPGAFEELFQGALGLAGILGVLAVGWYLRSRSR